MSLNLKLVESFVAVAEASSFSIAAARTNTVQSAISTQIKLLEEQIGRTLLERGRGKPVTLTDDGAAFLVQARRLLALADEIARPQVSTHAPLRIGTTITFALSVLPRALAAYNRTAPLSPVTVRTARSHELIELLDRDAVDIALILDQGAHRTRRATLQVALAWAASAEFQQTGTSPLPMAFLEDARDLRRHAFAALDQNGERAASLTTHPDPIGMRAVVGAGLAITVLPKVAIVAPLVDIGPALELPDLGSLPVSIYANPGARETEVSALVGRLESQLRS